MHTRSFRPVLGLASCLALALAGVSWMLLRPSSGLLPADARRETVSAQASAPSAGLVRPPGPASAGAEPVDPAPSPTRVRAAESDTTPGDGAVIHGSVQDPLGFGVPAVRVRILRGSEERAVHTEEDGRFQARGLPVGLYAVRIDPRSLPPDLLVMSGSDSEEDAPGGSPGLLRLTAGEEREVELRVVQVAQVSGAVVDLGGAPLVAARVALSSSGSVGAVTRTDVNGRFSFAQVRPGSCWLRVEAGSLESLRPGQLPLPQRFEVVGGQRLDLGRLVAGAGGHVLEGRVEDSSGTPLSGERVVCTDRVGEGRPVLAWAATDERGRFRLGRVPSALLEVAVTAPDRRGRPAPVGLQVDTRGAAEQVDLGVLRVEREANYRLSGSALVDPSWAAASGFDPWQVEVQVRSLEAEPGPSPLGDAALLARFPEATSGFSWSCATPHPAVELRFVLRSVAGDERSRSEVVRPRPGAAERLEVRFP
jgi:hypothetical protein